jgi:hypothetical protein
MDLIERRDHARKNLDAIMVADPHRVEIRAATGFSSSRPTPSIDGSWPCSIRRRHDALDIVRTRRLRRNDLKKSLSGGAKVRRILLLRRTALQPPFRDLVPPRKPHIELLCFLKEAVQHTRSAGRPADTAMKADRHHLGSVSALGMELLECVDQELLIFMDAKHRASPASSIIELH